MEIMNSAPLDPRAILKAENKKLKSRQESLLKKAEELHLLHNVQVLLLVYHPDKGEFVQYCSCEAQELVIAKVRAEEMNPERVTRLSENVRVVSESAGELQTGVRRDTKTTHIPTSEVSKPVKKHKPSPTAPAPAAKPTKQPFSVLSLDVDSLSTLDTAPTPNTPQQRDIHKGVPPWAAQPDNRRTVHSTNPDDESVSSLSDFLSDPY